LTSITHILAGAYRSNGQIKEAVTLLEYAVNFPRVLVHR
jgi:hypothetical protein